LTRLDYIIGTMYYPGLLRGSLTKMARASETGLFFNLRRHHFYKIPAPNLNQLKSVTSTKTKNLIRHEIAFGAFSKLKNQPDPSSPAFLEIRRRQFSTSSGCFHGGDHGNDRPGSVNVTFILKDGSRQDVLGRVGETALDLAHRYGIPMEGACEGSLACTTCHVYVAPDDLFDQLPEASEKEEDLLDGAPFLDINSRLGCQVIVEEELEGMELKLPRATRNFYVDGHVPEPH